MKKEYDCVTCGKKYIGRELDRARVCRSCYMVEIRKWGSAMNI